MSNSKYKIIKDLGKGGMGVVKLAEDTILQRMVALKFLPDDLKSDPQFSERFLREARALAKLRHRNIVTIYEVDSEQFFISMEYIEGKSLKAFIDEQQQKPIDQILDFSIQICEGLNTAHHAGIIHRDIKPDNVLIEKDGCIKLVDFGIARLKTETNRLTQAGNIMGTFVYMSPEQIAGKETDYRSDIFSFGILFYELLCRHLPFQGENLVAITYSISNQPPMPILQYRDDVPEELEKIVYKTLQKNPEDRYQNVRGLLAKLKIIRADLRQRHQSLHRAAPRYNILRKLGQGGMGEVFLADDTVLQRKTVLKFLMTAIGTDPEFQARFKVEAQAAAGLNHPNIVRIYDFGTYQDHPHQGKTYIAMEFVEGECLKNLIRNKSLIRAEKLDIAIQIGNALNHAHRKNVVHRDIKPENILVDPEGQVRILDFGLAKLANISARLTKTQSTLGTPHYMSPEQTQGIKEIDYRTDIFSFGVVLYELLTGELPFRGDKIEIIIYAIRKENPQLLKRHDRNTTKGLQKIIDLALKKNPDKRYQNIAGMVSDLKEEGKSRTSQNRSTVFSRSTVTSTIPVRKMRKSLYGISLLAGMAVILGLFFIWQENDRPFPSISFKNVFSIFYPSDDDNDVSITPPSIVKTPPAQSPPSLEQEDKTIIGKESPLETSGQKPPTPMINVVIETTPRDARVILDGERKSLNQLGNLSLTPGKHNVRISQTGYGSLIKGFELFSNDTTLIFSLVKITETSLVITSSPSGAAILFDGQLQGKTPNTMNGIPAGNYEVVLTKKGYQDYSTSVNIISDRRNNVSVPLKILMGKLRINATPIDVDFKISIDGQFKAKIKNQYNVDLTPGSHLIRIENPQVGVWQKNISIVAGSVEKMKADFIQTIKLKIISVDEAGQVLSGRIYLDNKFTSKGTPNLLKFSAGLHTVEVRKEGYRIAEKPITRNFETNPKQPLRFTLRKELNAGKL